jgi:voltage-gated potassium channel
MRRARADAVLAPYSITGHRLAQSLLRPHVVQFLDLTTKDVGMDVSIEQVRVAETSKLVSKTIKDMQLSREWDCDGHPHQRRRMLFNPPADTAVHGGDFLIVMGQMQNLRALEGLLTGAAAR